MITREGKRIGNQERHRKREGGGVVWRRVDLILCKWLLILLNIAVRTGVG